MSEEKLLEKINDKIRINDYKSANFRFAVQKENNQWKIIIVRVILDIQKPQENKTLLEYDDFRLEDVFISINQFFEFLTTLTKSNINKLNTLEDTLQIPDDCYFELGKYRFCFVGNFASDEMYFLSREQSREYHGMSKPVFQTSYSLNQILLSKDYRKLNLSTHDIPFRDVVEAINHFWGTKYEFHNMSSNNFHFYFPIYDASIAGCKIKDKHVKLTIDINHERTKLQDLYVGVIAEDKDSTFRDRINVTSDIPEFDLDIVPNTVYFSLSKNKERLDEFHWKSATERSRIAEMLIGVGAKTPPPIAIASKPTITRTNNDTLDLPILKDDFQDGIRVFISHKFVKNDQQLALTLQDLLLNSRINGYLAERKREYESPIDRKIKDEIERSDYLVAIITENSVISPSVNQEIGYAMGIKVPVLVMMEENLEVGVLIDAVDKENFNKDNFPEKSNNIMSYILQNGKRKKISDEEKKQLIDNVYKPCYNQMMNEYRGKEFISAIPSNKWKDLESFWQLKTEPEMKELFEQYTDELKKWHSMWVNYANNFQHNQSDLGEIIKTAFSKAGLLTNNHISLPEGSLIDPKDWLHAFMFVIFDNDIHGKEELYKVLLDFSIKTKNNHKKWLEEWHQNKPELFLYILETMPSLVEKLKTPVSIEQLNQQREVLKVQIEKLTLALEAKLK